MCLPEGFPIGPEVGIAGVDAVVRPQQAVAVGQHASAHGLEEVVARAKRQQLAQGQGRLGLSRAGTVASPLGTAPHAVGRRRHRRMGTDGVEGVVDVLEVDLPVGVEGRAQHATGHLQPALGGAVGQKVQGGHQFAHRGLEARAVTAGAREDESAVHCHLAIGRQPLSRAAGLERRARQPVFLRRREQGAVQPVRPGVVRAAQGLPDMAGPFRAQGRALVGATVVQHPHRTVVPAQHHHRLAS